MQAERIHQLAAMRLALHEMGHYVVARALGFRTGDVWIKVTPEGGNGISAILPETLSSLSDVKDYLERRALVLFSGILAEELQLHLSPQLVDRQKAWNVLEDRNINGDTDIAKAKEIVTILFNLSNSYAGDVDDEMYQAQAHEMNIAFFNRAADIIERNATSIIHFTKYIVERVQAVPVKISLDAATLENSPEINSIFPSTVWE